MRCREGIHQALAQRIQLLDGGIIAERTAVVERTARLGERERLRQHGEAQVGEQLLAQRQRANSAQATGEAATSAAHLPANSPKPGVSP